MNPNIKINVNKFEHLTKEKGYKIVGQESNKVYAEGSSLFKLEELLESLSHTVIERLVIASNDYNSEVIL